MNWRVYITNNQNLGASYFKTKKEAIAEFERINTSEFITESNREAVLQKKIAYEWFDVTLNDKGTVSCLGGQAHRA